MTNYRCLFYLLTLTSSILSAGVNADVFINELHYDNVGDDVNEKIEVIAPAGTNLAGWTLALYNGNGGAPYATLNLSGTIANQCNGYGTSVVNAVGIQNGENDGIALVDASNRVVQFISYEGGLTAITGVAAGLRSTDIGVSETAQTTSAQSLRLTGTGSRAGDFRWQAPATSSFGQCNPGQSFTTGNSDRVLSNGVAVTGLSGTANSVISYTMSVPTGAKDLSFSMDGGSGDADLYVRFGSAPTTSSYDCRPFRSGNREICTFAQPAAGIWFISLRGYTGYSGISLTGRYTANGGGGGGGSGYYASVNASSASTLRASLHAIIDDNSKVPYTAPTTDSWDALDFADEDPLDSRRILDIYKNASYSKAGGGNDFYNREHTWPKSLGFPDEEPTNYPYTDLHMLMLSDSSYNSSRSNKVYGNCNARCSELPTNAYAGQGGGRGVFPGNSNWTNGDIFQVWNKRKGNVARAVFYMDIRYEGGTHGVSQSQEPDLRLTDNLSLIKTTNGNASTAYMGLLSVLLQWHLEDPVDETERLRNDAIQTYQGNRNPFIDQPQWVSCIYQNRCN